MSGKKSWTFCSSNDDEKKCCGFTKISSILIIIINVSWATNQYIKMISEGSCDTETEEEKLALITGIKYIQMENS